MHQATILWNRMGPCFRIILFARITFIFGPKQAIEVSRRQARVRESNGHPDYVAKLGAAETKLEELKSNMAKLGKEAAAAMAAVEAQQQRLTLQRLITMVMLSLCLFCSKPNTILLQVLVYWHRKLVILF